MRTAFLLAAASALHSVHRSTSRHFLDDGAPNVAYLERDRFVCFVEGEGGEGGGEGKSSAPKFDDVQQEHVNGLIAKERRAGQSKLDAISKEHNDLKARLEQIELEKNEAGKSEKERSLAAVERERAARETAEKKLADTEVRIRERDTDVAVSTSMSKLRIAPSAAEDAPAAFRRAAKIELNADGRISSVEVDGELYSTLDKATEAWLKKRPHFEAAPAGGVGSRPSSAGGSGKPLHEQSDDELIRASNAARRGR